MFEDDFSNGNYIPFKNEETFENINPATEEVLGYVAKGSKEDEAVSTVRKSLKGEWSKLTTQERSKILRKVGDLILERKAELATLETLDTGIPSPLYVCV